MYIRTLWSFAMSPTRHCINCRLKAAETAIGMVARAQFSRTLCYKTSVKGVLVDKPKSSAAIPHFSIPYQPSRSLLDIANFLGTTGKTSAWSQAVTEAEKVVGYPTSFMSLRCLLSDEFSNVAMQMRKLVGTKHPLLKTARRFIYDGTESLQIRGLLVLLISKAAGPGPTVTNPTKDDNIEPMVSGIYPRQRHLAEIAEMIHTAYLVHTGVVDISVHIDEILQENIQFGNKLAVLCGDFLLANASTALARLYDTEVTYLISSAIRDMAAAEFTMVARTKSFPSTTSQENTIKAWEKQTFMSSGSLLAKGCKAALMLSRHSEDKQEAAYEFGRTMGFAYQLHEDLRSVVRQESDTSVPSMTSLPVAIHIHKKPEHRDLITNLISTSSAKAHKQILAMLSSSGTIAQVRHLLTSYQEKALSTVKILGESEASTAIANIVQAVTDV